MAQYINNRMRALRFRDYVMFWKTLGGNGWRPVGTTWAYVQGGRFGDTLAMGSTHNEQQWVFGGVTEKEFVSDQLAKCKKLPDVSSR